MVIEKQINVRGNANVVADTVHIHLGSAAAPLDRSLLLRAAPTVALGVALGMSLTALDTHPALVGSVAIGFLLSLAVLLRGTKDEGTAVERGAEGHLQHHSQGRGTGR
jgi:hypothetical protein